MRDYSWLWDFLLGGESVLNLGYGDGYDSEYTNKPLNYTL